MMVSTRSSRHLAAAALFAVAWPLDAASPLESRSATQVTTRPDVDPFRHISLDGSIETVQLEPFEVFAIDLQVVTHTDSGTVTLPRPQTRFFRGRIAGEEASLAFVAVGPQTKGILFARGSAFTLTADAAQRNLIATEGVSPATASDQASRCYIDPTRRTRSARASRTRSSASTPSVFDIRLAIETDYELFQKLGGAQQALDYLGLLIGAASAIYNRDVNANLQVGYLSLWATPADPWDAPLILAGEVQVANYWHANRTTVLRNLVMFLGGRYNGGGVAHFDGLCEEDLDLGNGNWTGAYAASGVYGPLSTTNPSFLSDLYFAAHEIGHSCGSDHTHCYVPPIDHCYSGETACYFGPKSVPPEGGTLMSYCDTQPGGFANIRLTLGRPGEPSQAVTDLIRARLESKASCLTIASACSIEVSPLVASFGPAPATGAITLTGVSTCPWTATSNASFIKITSHDLGSGSASLTYSVSQNLGPARSGTLTVAGRTVTITQSDCAGGNQALCLSGARFRVTVAWKNPYDGGSTGVGVASPLTADTGAFWFFDQNNIELVVKILDGRSTNGKFWLAYGALSDVEYTITATDTQTGVVRTYYNPPKALLSVIDINAF